MKTTSILNAAIGRLRKVTTLVFLIMCLLSSCVYSLFPIYTDDTLIFETTLLGTWEDIDGYKITFERFSNESLKERFNKGEEKINHVDSFNW